MLLKPRISKFIKSFRPKLKDSNVNIKGCKLIFGSTGFQASKSVTINAKEIETCRILIRRSLGRKIPIWVRVFPHTPIRKKGLSMRIGKGKGAVDTHVARVNSGQILFEVYGLRQAYSLRRIKVLAKKLSNKLGQKILVLS